MSILRFLEIGNSLPYSFPADPNATFEPGMIAQLTAVGNQTVATVSDGRAPIGIIDEIRTKSFSAVSMDEIVIGASTGVMQGGQLVAPIDVKVPLRFPNISPSSFISNPVDVELIPVNGVAVFLAGTPLNFSMTGSGTPDAIRTVVSYSYQVPNVPGDDSTQGSGRMTVWFQRCIAATDQYDVSARYALGANLFVGIDGKLTTKQYMANLPVVATTLGIPINFDGTLEFMWR